MTVYENLSNRQLDMSFVLQRLEGKQKVVGCVSSEDDILFRICEAVYEILSVLIQIYEPDTETNQTGEKALKDWTLEEMAKYCGSQLHVCEECPACMGEELEDCRFRVPPCRWWPMRGGAEDE